jgi:Cytochrome P460
MMKSARIYAAMAVPVLLMLACTTPPPSSGKAASILKDGELPLPADYKTWPRFLLDVQRPDAKQVRDIYINPIGYAAQAGKPFPYGTVTVMENHKVQLNADGTPVIGADGKLIKSDLAAIFVMGKGEGWGKGVADNLATGEWIFSAYKPDGAKSDADLNTCRACHAPLKDKDFVQRFDEFFATR